MTDNEGRLKTDDDQVPTTFEKKKRKRRKEKNMKRFEENDYKQMKKMTMND